MPLLLWRKFGFAAAWREAGGVFISISLPYYNGSALTVFFYKSFLSPNSIYTRVGEA